MSAPPNSDGSKATMPAGFDGALGTHRGQNRAELERLLAGARQREIEQLARIAELTKHVEDGRASIDRLDGELEVAQKQLEVRDGVFERSFFDLNAAICAYLREHDEADGVPSWGYGRYAASSRSYGMYQGEFSPRRPYLQGDDVRVGKDRCYTALVNINPSRIPPYERPDLWANRGDVSQAPEIGFVRHPDSLVDDWRYEVEPERFTDTELQQLIADAREGAGAQWRRECNLAIISFPCPAYAYRDGREWLEDMPGYRAVVADLRRRKRARRRSAADEERSRSDVTAQQDAAHGRQPQR